mmetsp:Transcript_101/g.217  ORF Transcript_101/g.217 Transcript_101/m.217 type:complete len:217 (+) Transcript_101:3481-4131(+)
MALHVQEHGVQMRLLPGGTKVPVAANWRAGLACDPSGLKGTEEVALPEHAVRAGNSGGRRWRLLLFALFCGWGGWRLAEQAWNRWRPHDDANPAIDIVPILHARVEEVTVSFCIEATVRAHRIVVVIVVGGVGQQLAEFYAIVTSYPEVFPPLSHAPSRGLGDLLLRAAVGHRKEAGDVHPGLHQAHVKSRCGEGRDILGHDYDARGVVVLVFVAS